MLVGMWAGAVTQIEMEDAQMAMRLPLSTAKIDGAFTSVLMVTILSR